MKEKILTNVRLYGDNGTETCRKLFTRKEITKAVEIYREAKIYGKIETIRRFRKEFYPLTFTEGVALYELCLIILG